MKVKGKKLKNLLDKIEVNIRFQLLKFLLRNILIYKQIKPFIDKIFPFSQSKHYLENHQKQAKACLSETARRHVKKYERQIDQIVYKLYDLTEDEIKIVEGSSKKKHYL